MLHRHPPHFSKIVYPLHNIPNSFMLTRVRLRRSNNWSQIHYIYNLCSFILLSRKNLCLQNEFSCNTILYSQLIQQLANHATRVTLKCINNWIDLFRLIYGKLLAYHIHLRHGLIWIFHMTLHTSLTYYWLRSKNRVLWFLVTLAPKFKKPWQLTSPTSLSFILPTFDDE
jgi:hypothetical protein